MRREDAWRCVCLTAVQFRFEEDMLPYFKTFLDLQIESQPMSCLLPQSLQQGLNLSFSVQGLVSFLSATRDDL